MSVPAIKKTDPPPTWTRLEFDEARLVGLNWRERSEIETDRDLIKPIQQLVCDFHETLARADDERVGSLDYAKWMAHAQKRMVSMMAKVAISNNDVQLSNDVLQRRIWWLSVIVGTATILGTFFGLAQFFK
jgi:hypothetical protein